MIAHIKIIQDKDNPSIHRVFRDGTEITGVNHIDLNIDTYELPSINVGICGGCEFEGLSDIEFDYSPKNISEACKIILDELRKHGGLYNGFLSSIESSLKEQKVTGLPFQPESDIADKILRRIIGEE